MHEDLGGTDEFCMKIWGALMGFARGFRGCSSFLQGGGSFCTRILKAPSSLHEDWGLILHEGSEGRLLARGWRARMVLHEDSEGSALHERGEHPFLCTRIQSAALLARGWRAHSFCTRTPKAPSSLHEDCGLILHEGSERPLLARGWRAQIGFARGFEGTA